MPGLHSRERHRVWRRAWPRRDPGTPGTAVEQWVPAHSPCHAPLPRERPAARARCWIILIKERPGWGGLVESHRDLSGPFSLPLPMCGQDFMPRSCYFEIFGQFNAQPICHPLYTRPPETRTPLLGCTLTPFHLCCGCSIASTRNLLNCHLPRPRLVQCNNGSVIVPNTASPIVICHVDGFWSDNQTTRCVLASEAPAPAPPAPPGEQVTCCVKFDQTLEEVWSDGNRVRISRISSAWCGL